MKQGQAAPATEIKASRLAIAERLIRWSVAKTLADSQATKIISLIPVFGYIILLSDLVAENLEFQALTGSDLNITFLSSTLRLQFYFWGSISIFLAFAWHQIHCPREVKESNTRVDYETRFVQRSTISEINDVYRKLKSNIQQNSSGDFLIKSKEFDDAYLIFMRAMMGISSAPRKQGIDELIKSSETHVFFDSEDKKALYTQLLIRMAREHYERCERKKLNHLKLTLGCFAFGYFLFLIPSLDTIFAVIRGYIV